MAFGSGRRYLGIQWRLLASHAAAGAMGAGLGAGALAAGWAAGLGGLALVAAGAAGALFGVALAAWHGLQVARHLKRRLRAVGRFAAALAAGDLSHRLVPEGADEVAQIEQELNEMAGRLAGAMAALRDLAERNRELAYEAGALAERARLARDLHDTVNQELFSLSLLAAALRRRLDQGQGAAQGPGTHQGPAEVAAALAEMEALARRAHATVRELILALRPPSLAQQGLAGALREYAAAFASRHGLTCTCLAEVPRLPPAVEEALLRMAQEALHNVAKHAAATAVQVEVAVAGGQVHLTVRDNGRGFDPAAPAPPAAVGLASMRERAAALGGQVAIRSSPGQGTEVRVTVPLPQQPPPGDSCPGDGTPPAGRSRDTSRG